MAPNLAFDEISAMAPHLPTMWNATDTPIVISDEPTETETAATAKLDSPDPMLPMGDVPTTAVPEPASWGFLLLSTGFLFVSQFRRRNRQG